MATFVGPTNRERILEKDRINTSAMADRRYMLLVKKSEKETLLIFRILDAKFAVMLILNSDLKC